MSSTITALVELRRTDQQRQSRLLRSSFTIPKVEGFSLNTLKVARGKSVTVSFTKLLYCTVDIPTLIRLTIGNSAVEFEMESSLLLPAQGSIEFTNPLNSTVLLDANIEYFVL